MKKKIFATVVLVVLVCAFVFALTACNNAESIERRLIKAGYEVDGGYIGGESIDSEEEIQGLMWYLYGRKENSDGTYEIVTIYCFDKISQAKDVAALMNVGVGYLRGSAPSTRGPGWTYSEGYAVKQKGTLVLFGTSQAVKDAL